MGRRATWCPAASSRRRSYPLGPIASDDGGARANGDGGDGESGNGTAGSASGKGGTGTPAGGKGAGGRGGQGGSSALGGAGGKGGSTGGGTGGAAGCGNLIEAGAGATEKLVGSWSRANDDDDRRRQRRLGVLKLLAICRFKRVNRLNRTCTVSCSRSCPERRRLESGASVRLL